MVAASVSYNPSAPFPRPTSEEQTRHKLLDFSPRPAARQAPSSSPGLLSHLGSSVNRPEQLAQDTLAKAQNKLTSREILAADEDPRKDWGDEPFHFHIFGHKHNTHITVTKPDRNAILSLSTGQIGFRKAKRGTYDAAYQLCAYVIDKLHQGNWHKEMHKLEVVLRGFGNGREAATKVLLGNEGKLFRGKIVKVSDSTRLKFGGTRSKKPRRLG
jgi:small subunit ribosomal protein S11